MIVLEFRGVCRTHGQDKTIRLQGRDTPRKISEGYAKLAREMTCDDYSRTHSVQHEVRHI